MTDTPTGATLTLGDFTYGEGDQWTLSQKLDGGWVTVVNDGVGPDQTIDNGYNRLTSNLNNQGFTRKNHQPYLLSNLNLSPDLTSQSWSETVAYGYTNPPLVGNPFYCFGALAIGDDKYVMNLGLADGADGKRHDNRFYNDPEPVMPRLDFSGQAFAVYQDGAWNFKDGVALGSRDWAAAMPQAACTMVPGAGNLAGEFDNGAWTMGTFLQMGPGYQWNKDIGWEDGHTRGYIYLFSPRAALDEHSQPNNTNQRSTMLARMWVGDNAESDAVSKLGSVFNTDTWKVFTGLDGNGKPTWSIDVTDANAVTVMTWPEIGTSHGQAWYPSVTYVKSHDVFVAIGSSLHLTDYPTRASRLVVKWAPKPWGPWTDLWDSFTDNGDNVFLQGNGADRVFSPNWGPIVDVDADTVDLNVCFSSVGAFETDGWTQSVKQRYGMNWSKLRLSFAAVEPPPGDGATVTDVILPPQTRGEGDQFPWTQKLDGTHYTVVNDGRGPYTSIGNDTNRQRDSILANYGTRWNHKPFHITNLSLSNLNSPSWTTGEIGYTNPPTEPEHAFYCFGCLAIGNDKLILNIALSGPRHKNSSYRTPLDNNPWSGQAFAVYQGGSWRYRDGVAHGSRNWANSMPVAACTFTPPHAEGGTEFQNSPWTEGTFLQMGPGYQWNKDVGWDVNIRGYLFLYSPKGCIDEHAAPSDTLQRSTILSRVWVGDDGEAAGNDLEHIFDPDNWEVLTAVDSNGNATWSSSMTQANSLTIMSWPVIGTFSGQAWYPTVTYLKSVGMYVAVATTLQMVGYPDTAISLFEVKAAPKPWGPWTTVYTSDDQVHLQGDVLDKVFSPNWVPGWCDIDAGTDGQGRQLVDCHISFSGLGDVDDGVNDWGQNDKKRYGINIGKIRLAFDTAAPPTPPVANDDAAQVIDGQTVAIDVLANDTGTDLSIVSAGPAAHGAVSIAGGQLSYAHNQGSGVGGSDPFAYTIEDSAGQQAGATVTVAIAAAPQPPVANDDAASVIDGQTVDIDVLANDTGTGLSIVSTGPATHGTVSIVGGQVRYAHNQGSGVSDSDPFTYTIENVAGLQASAMVTVGIEPPVPPVANNDAANVIDGQTVEIDVLANDTGTDLSIVSAGPAAHGAVSIVGGQVRYSHSQGSGVGGSDPFAYTIEDNAGQQAGATVTVDIEPPPPPVASDDVAQVADGQMVDIDVLANDTGTDLSIISAGPAVHGTVSIIGGQVRYAHNSGSGVGGSDPFIYVIEDNAGQQASATATVSIAAAPPLPPPGDSSAIDPDLPAAGASVVKADIRRNMAAARDEINHGGFYRAGGTGAIWRKVEDREREFPQLTDYGTDWSALVTALEENDFLVIPPGVYDMEPGYAFNISGKTIWGYGAVLRFGSRMEPHGWTDIRWYGVEFDGQETADEAIRLRDSRDWLFQDCSFHNFTWNGLHLMGRHPGTGMTERQYGITLRSCRIFDIGSAVDPSPPNAAPADKGAWIFVPSGIERLTIEECTFERSGGHGLHFLGQLAGAGEGIDRPLSDVVAWNNAVLDAMFTGLFWLNDQVDPGGMVIAANHVWGCGRRQPGTIADPGSGQGCGGLFLGGTAKDPHAAFVYGNRLELMAQNGIEGAFFSAFNVIRQTAWRFDELHLPRGVNDVAPEGHWLSGGAAIANSYVDIGTQHIRLAGGSAQGEAFGQYHERTAVLDCIGVGQNNLHRTYGQAAAEAGIATVEVLAGFDMIFRRVVIDAFVCRGVPGQHADDRSIRLSSGDSGQIEATVVVQSCHTHDLLGTSIESAGVSDGNRVDGVLE